MSGQLTQIIDRPCADGDGNSVIAQQGSLEQKNELVFGVEVWISKDKRFATKMIGAAEGVENGLAGNSKRNRVGHDQGRFLAEQFPEHTWGQVERAGVEFQSASVARNAQCAVEPCPGHYQ